MSKTVPEPTPEPVKATPEKWYRIDLSRTWKQPTAKGALLTGRLYSRGGYMFTTDRPFHVVPASELEKFMVAKDRRFASEPVVKVLDPNLTCSEVPAPTDRPPAQG